MKPRLGKTRDGLTHILGEYMGGLRCRSGIEGEYYPFPWFVRVDEENHAITCLACLGSADETSPHQEIWTP